MEMAGEILGQLLAACVGTAAFSALFGVPKKYWLDCGICGAVRLGRVSGGHGSLSDADHRDLRGERGFDDAVALSGGTAESADAPLSGLRHLPACARSGDLLYRLQLFYGAGSAGAPVWHGYNQDGGRNRAGDRSGIFASGTPVWMEAGDRGVGT